LSLALDEGRGDGESLGERAGPEGGAEEVREDFVSDVLAGCSSDLEAPPPPFADVAALPSAAFSSAFVRGMPMSTSPRKVAPSSRTTRGAFDIAFDVRGAAQDDLLLGRQVALDPALDRDEPTRDVRVHPALAAHADRVVIERDRAIDLPLDEQIRTTDRRPKGLP